MFVESFRPCVPKYAIEMCQITKIGQIVVLCDLSDTHSAYSMCTKTLTKGQRIVEFSVCLFESTNIF